MLKRIILLSFLLSIVSNLNCAQAAGPNRELMAALNANNIDGVNEAIAAGADINFRSIQGYTPLMQFSAAGNLEAVRLLLDMDADLDLLGTRDNATPVIMASRFGQPEAIRLLLDRKPDWINKVDNSGFTPLMNACSEVQVSAVQLLIERGADIDVRGHNRQNIQGMNALDLVRARLRAVRNRLAMYLMRPEDRANLMQREQGCLAIINLLQAH